MSSLDNANPTVHTTGKQKTLAASHDLFSTDKSTYWQLGDDSSEEDEELLDADEIFGGSFLMVSSELCN